MDLFHETPKVVNRSFGDIQQIAEYESSHCQRVSEISRKMFSYLRKKIALLLALTAVLIGGLGHSAFADSIFDISIDTTALFGTDALLAFDFIDGDAVVNNVVTLTHFTTDGNLGTASSIGGVTGTLPGTVTLADSDFFTSLEQDLTLGNTLHFTLNLTDHFAGGIFPDSFAFSMLDPGTYASLFSTSDPLGQALFAVDLDGTGLGNFQNFTDANTIDISLDTNPVPEPGTLLLITTGMIGLAGYRRRGYGKKPVENRV